MGNTGRNDVKWDQWFSANDGIIRIFSLLRFASVFPMFSKKLVLLCNYRKRSALKGRCYSEKPGWSSIFG